jgi:hypothetical protein
VLPRGVRAGEGALGEAGKRCVREGLFGNPTEIWHNLRVAESRHSLTPDESLFRDARYSQPVPRQVITHAPPLKLPDPGEGQRLLAIGDLHQDPRHPDRLDVLTWLARYASEQQFPRIIQVGDWSTYDSVNQHDDNSTWAARTKPGIKDDLDNLKQSLSAWRRGINYKPRQTVLYGNHENRLERFENANPEAVDTFTLSRDEAFAVRLAGAPLWRTVLCRRRGFHSSPDQWCWPSRYGGKTGPQRAANESLSLSSAVILTDGKSTTAPRLGLSTCISMVEIGCGLPWGTVEDYAKHSLTGWWYGVCDMTVRDGRSPTSTSCRC